MSQTCQRLARAAIALVGLALAACSGDRQAPIAESTPELPDIAGLHPGLVARIQKADKKARQGQPEGLRELATLYHANGFLAEAWQAYGGLIALEPDEPAHPYRLGVIMSGYGQLAEAAPLFRRVIELQPSYVPAHIRLGDALLKLNQLEDAQAAYQRALEVSPKNPYANVGLGRVAIARDDLQTARARLESAAVASEMRVGADLFADVLERLGETAQARSALANTPWGSYSDIPDPWIIELRQDSYDAKEVAFAGGWAAHGDDVDTGIRLMERAISLDPANAMNRYQLGTMFLRKGDRAAAEAQFEAAAEHEPNLADAWLQLYELAQAAGNSSLAQSRLRQGLAHNPNSPSLNIEKANQLFEAGRQQEALEFYKRSIEHRPNEAVGYVQLARAYFRMGNAEAGLAEMRNALKVEPAHPLGLSTMAFDAIHKGDREEANRWIRLIANQPRIPPEEIAQLRQLYLQQFGR